MDIDIGTYYFKTNRSVANFVRSNVTRVIYAHLVHFKILNA